jgi:DNA-binding NarL/FixJ family response regulator
VKVVIAEDALVVREGLVALLTSEPDVEIVGTATTFDELMTVVDQERPDVVITDIRMPPTGTDEGIRAAALLRDSLPTVGVVVLSQHLEPAYALALLGTGAERRGYLLKERVGDADQLLDAIRTVANGGSYVDPLVVGTLVRGRAADTADGMWGLARRELDVLTELATGRSNAAIAERLCLSERSVEKYINTVFVKLGLEEDRSSNRRVKAALLFLGATSL